MQTKEKKYFRNNIILILFFILFFLSFSSIKKVFNSSTKEKSTPDVFLYSINNSIEESSSFFSNIAIFFSSKKYLLNQIADLQNQLDKQKYYSVIDSTKEDFGDMSNSANNNQISKNKNLTQKDLPIIAKKIFSDFTSIYDTVLLDKGFSSGVKKGDVVFLYPNLLIGQIDVVNPNTSLVSLYSKDKNKIEGVVKVLKVSKDDNNIAMLNNSTTSSSSKEIISNTNIKPKTGGNILIDLYGNGGGDFIATLPQNLEVSTGTLIYLSSDESKIIGEVVKVEKQDASFYEIILIKGYYNTRLNDDYYIMHK